MSIIIFQNEDANVKSVAEADPGPKVLYSTDFQVVIEAKDSSLSVSAKTMEEAVIMCLGMYYIKNLTFPASFGPILGLLQSVIMPEDDYVKGFASGILQSAIRNVVNQL